MLRYLSQWFRNRLGASVLPLELILFVTGRCNFRCDHCFIEEFETKPSADLPLEAIEKLARENPNLMVLMLTGGEPFLRADLPQIVAAFSRHARPKVISLVTNGFLTGQIEAAVKAILAIPEFRSQLVISFSFEGIGPAHDEQRGRKGSYEAALRTAAQLKELSSRDPRLKIGANVTLVPGNAASVVATTNQLAATGLFSFFSQNFYRTGQAREPSQAVDLAAYRALSENVFRLSREFQMGGSRWLGRIHRAKEAIQSEIIERTSRAKSYQALPCEAGRQIGVVYSTGAVAPCELLSPSWGNIREQSFKEIWNRAANRRASHQLRKEKCFCTHECFIGASLNTRPLPLLRTIGRALSSRETHAR